MQHPTPKKSKWPIAALCLIFAPVVYILSYAPFLACTNASENPFYYRSPKFYRAAEWVILKTRDSGTFTHWNKAFGVEGTVEWQLIFYILESD